MNSKILKQRNKLNDKNILFGFKRSSCLTIPSHKLPIFEQKYLFLGIL